jgi:hypothetical protein
MFTRIWFAAALTRALRTLAQTAVALIGTTSVIEGVDWRVVASGSILAAGLSMLTSLAGLPEAPTLTPLEREADAQGWANDRSLPPYV